MRDFAAGKDALPEAARRALLEQHGDFAVAYSVAMQPGLSHFGDERGFLGYRMVGRTAFVLADPIAPKDRHGPLIDAFIAEKKDVTFWQVSHATAVLLSRRGFSINEFGTLTTLDLKRFGFSGPDRRSFRTAANRYARSGHSVVEKPMSRFDPAALKAISEGWRRSKATSHHELRFLVRPLPLEDEPGVRKFVLVDADGVPEAFAAFDPVYEGGAVTSYLSYTRRWLPSAGPLASYALVRAAIETFQREGVATLHLGLSPFHRIVDAEFQKAWVVKRAFRFLYTNRLANRWVYPLRSLAWHKDSFGGEARQSYCAINTMPALPRLLKLLLACRIV